MKRTVILTVGVVALSAAIYVGSLYARPTTPTSTPAPAQPKTRVAIFNLTYVIKNYSKFTTFNDELKTLASTYTNKDKALKAQVSKLATEAQDPKTTAEKREKLESDAKSLNRQIEDNKLEAQKAIGKKQGEQIKILYQDVAGVVGRVAASRGFEMVLHYNDVLDNKEYWSEPNVARKMQAGALMPIYWTGGLDISQTLVTTLNQQYKAAPKR